MCSKKHLRPAEVDRPDVRAKRHAFLTWMRGVDPDRPVFIDEAGANIAMGRSHAWVQRGTEYVEARPMNWGDNLTLIGALRRDGWVTLSTKWRAVNSDTFLTWVRSRLQPRLRPGDIVVLDNLKAHKQLAVRLLVEQRGATVRYLPPYSHDLNPIEPAWRSSRSGFERRRPATRAHSGASHGPRATSFARTIVRIGSPMSGTATQVSLEGLRFGRC